MQPTPEQDWQTLLAKPIPKSLIKWPDAQAQNPSFMLHLEQRESFVNGNKGYKALPNIMAAKRAGFSQLLSFGGRHSNHLYALAMACKRYRLALVAVVRGYPEQAVTPTISAIKAMGASVIFVGHGEYKKRYQQEFIEKILQQVGDSWVIPEGGNNHFAKKGVAALAKQLAKMVAPNDYLALAVGTGTTLTGLLAEPSLSQVNVLAVPVLHNKESLQQSVAAYKNCRIISGFEGAGFGKMSLSLAQFMTRFEALQSIQLDPVYTGKLLQGVEQLHQQGYFADNQRVFCLHTGGLQGRQAMQAKLDQLAATGAE